ncbi:MAG TPA: hypothetical protein VF993_14625, partial [Myxococcales bacterium]
TEDREALGRERRLHKETAVLLHEWAHTLGALHEETPRESLMTPRYDQAQSSFTPGTARLVEIGLRDRNDLASWEKDYRAALEDPGAGGNASSRRDGLAAAEKFFSARARGEFALPQGDANRFREAAAKRQAGDAAGAWALLAPIAQRYPRLEPVQEFACTLAAEGKAGDAAAVCAGAAALPGSQPRTSIFAAALLLDAGGRSEALRLLQRAEEKLPAAEAEAWLVLAQQYERGSACFGAERAARRATGLAAADAIVTACAHARHFVGFPRDAAALSAEREPDYVAAVQAAQEDIDAGRYERALFRAEELRRNFPRTPGAALIECRARSRGRAIDLTRTACSAAAEAAPDAFLPQYILGLVAAEEGRWTDAARSMQRAIQIDDGTPQVWASLAAVSVKLRDARSVQDLSVRYQKRFQVRLQPALWPAGWAAK